MWTGKLSPEASDGKTSHNWPHMRSLQVPVGYQGPLLSRPINASCVQIPNELPGVFSVAAVGVQKLRAYYSNYSKQFIQVPPSCFFTHLATARLIMLSCSPRRWFLCLIGCRR